MKLSIASDHAGFEYKEAIKTHLQDKGHEVVDFGTDSDAASDYPDFVRPAAQAVARGDCEAGIVLGGSGNGEAITANKVRGIRCAVVWSAATAEWSKQHNNANMISFGARTVSREDALEYVDIWLRTKFEGGRHIARVNKIEEGL